MVKKGKRQKRQSVGSFGWQQQTQKSACDDIASASLIMYFMIKYYVSILVILTHSYIIIIVTLHSHAILITWPTTTFLAETSFHFIF